MYVCMFVPIYRHVYIYFILLPPYREIKIALKFRTEIAIVKFWRAQKGRSGALSQDPEAIRGKGRVNPRKFISRR